MSERDDDRQVSEEWDAAATEMLRVEVAHQLAAELHGRAYPLAVLVGPEAVGALDTDTTADRLATQLVEAIGSDADKLLGTVVTDIMCALWSACGPPPEWWSTAVGRACAHSIGDTDHTDTVTHSVAAAMLGAARGSIGSMVQRGELVRGDDGGVTVASIKTRLAR